MQNIIYSEKLLDAMGYGIGIISPSIFEAKRKEHKIKTKKMLSFFDKNNDVFYDFINNGAFIPLPKLPSYYYQVFFSFGSSEPLKEWQIAKSWDGFQIEVSDNILWVLSFEKIQNWNYRELLTNREIETFYMYEDKKNIAYKGILYDIPDGKYNVKISGLRHTLNKEEFRNTFAFLFNLGLITEFKKSKDPTEIDYRVMFQI